MKLAPILAFLTFTSCSWFGKVEEGDRNTFTWKGRLVKDCNEEPVANATIFIQYNTIDLGLQEGDVKEIVRGTTDANGYFSLTYRRIRRPDAANVSLCRAANPNSESGSILINAPVNHDIDRNVADNSCILVYLDVINESGKDSLYVSFGKTFNSDHYISVGDTNISPYKTQVQAIELNGANFNYTYHVQHSVGYTWDNVAYSGSYGYATSFNEFMTNYALNHNDSIPDEDKPRNRFDVRGYPKIDTIQIEI